MNANTVQCPKSIAVVAQVLRVAAMLFGVLGPFFLFLIMCAACRESADASFNTVVFGGSAAMLAVSASLIMLFNRTLKGTLWAYYAVLFLVGALIVYMTVDLLVYHQDNWFIVVAPAIFFLLLIVPFKQYRKYAESQKALKQIVE